MGTSQLVYDLISQKRDIHSNDASSNKKTWFQISVKSVKLIGYKKWSFQWDDLELQKHREQHSHFFHISQVQTIVFQSKNVYFRHIVPFYNPYNGHNRFLALQEIRKKYGTKSPPCYMTQDIQ